MTIQSDSSLIIFLGAGGGGCSLDSSPKKNWVENGGGLPQYICKIAKGVMKSGKSKSSSIAIAVSRVKKWAAGGDDVDADTKAKAVKAVAEWEALKAKHSAKKIVSASRNDQSEYLMFSNIGSFNTDLIRVTWNNVQDKLRSAERAAARAQGIDPYDSPETSPYTYIRELWTDYIIVEIEGRGGPTSSLAKIPYTVSNGNVSFGEMVPVEQQYVEVDDTDYDEELTELEAALLGDVLVLSGSRLDYLTSLAKR